MKHKMHDNNSHTFIETYLEIQETEHSSHAYKNMTTCRTVCIAASHFQSHRTNDSDFSFGIQRADRKYVISSVERNMLCFCNLLAGARRPRVFCD